MKYLYFISGMAVMELIETLLKPQVIFKIKLWVMRSTKKTTLPTDYYSSNTYFFKNKTT
jgi:hypothetical protein